MADHSPVGINDLPDVINKRIDGFTDTTALHAAALQECSPCQLWFGDSQAAIEDEPYNTASCDFACIGKWPAALGRLASAIDRRLPTSSKPYARFIDIRLDLSQHSYIIKYYGAPRLPLKIKDILTYHAYRTSSRFEGATQISTHYKDGIIWGDASIVPVSKRDAQHMPQLIELEDYPLTLRRSTRPTVKLQQGGNSLHIVLPYNDPDDERRDALTIGYSFPIKHVRIYSNRRDRQSKREVVQ